MRLTGGRLLCLVESDPVMLDAKTGAQMWSPRLRRTSILTPVHTEDLVVVVVGRQTAKSTRIGLGKVNEVVAYDARSGKVPGGRPCRD